MQGNPTAPAAAEPPLRTVRHVLSEETLLDEHHFLVGWSDGIAAELEFEFVPVAVAARGGEAMDAAVGAFSRLPTTKRAHLKKVHKCGPKVTASSRQARLEVLQQEQLSRECSQCRAATPLVCLYCRAVFCEQAVCQEMHLRAHSGMCAMVHRQLELLQSSRGMGSAALREYTLHRSGLCSVAALEALADAPEPQLQEAVRQATSPLALVRARMHLGVGQLRSARSSSINSCSSALAAAALPTPASEASAALPAGLSASTASPSSFDEDAYPDHAVYTSAAAIAAAAAAAAAAGVAPSAFVERAFLQTAAIFQQSLVHKALAYIQWRESLVLAVSTRWKGCTSFRAVSSAVAPLLRLCGGSDGVVSGHKKTSHLWSTPAYRGFWRQNFEQLLALPTATSTPFRFHLNALYELHKNFHAVLKSAGGAGPPCPIEQEPEEVHVKVMAFWQELLDICGRSRSFTTSEVTSYCQKTLPAPAPCASAAGSPTAAPQANASSSADAAARAAGSAQGSSGHAAPDEMREPACAASPAAEPASPQPPDDDMEPMEIDRVSPPAEQRRVAPASPRSTSPADGPSAASLDASASAAGPGAGAAAAAADHCADAAVIVDVQARLQSAFADNRCLLDRDFRLAPWASGDDSARGGSVTSAVRNSALIAAWALQLWRGMNVALMEPMVERLRTACDVDVRRAASTPTLDDVGLLTLQRARVLFTSPLQAMPEPSADVLEAEQHCFRSLVAAAIEHVTSRTSKTSNVVYDATGALCNLFFLTATPKDDSESLVVTEALQEALLLTPQIFQAAKALSKSVTAHAEASVSQLAVLAFHMLLVQTQYGLRLPSSRDCALQLIGMREACDFLVEHVELSKQPERFLEGLAVLHLCRGDQRARLLPWLDGFEQAGSGRIRMWPAHLQRSLRAQPGAAPSAAGLTPANRYDKVHLEAVLLMVHLILGLQLPALPGAEVAAEPERPAALVVLPSATVTANKAHLAGISRQPASKRHRSAAAADLPTSVVVHLHALASRKATPAAPQSRRSLRAVASSSLAERHKESGESDASEADEAQDDEADSEGDEAAARPRGSAEQEAGPATDEDRDESDEDQEDEEHEEPEEERKQQERKCGRGRKPTQQTMSGQLHLQRAPASSAASRAIFRTITFTTPQSKLVHFNADVMQRVRDGLAVVLKCSELDQTPPPKINPRIKDASAVFRKSVLHDMTLGVCNNNGVRSPVASKSAIEGAWKSESTASACEETQTLPQDVHAFIEQEWAVAQRRRNGDKSAKWPAVPAAFANRTYLKDAGTADLVPGKARTRFFPHEDQQLAYLRDSGSVADPAIVKTKAVLEELFSLQHMLEQMHTKAAAASAGAAAAGAPDAVPQAMAAAAQLKAMVEAHEQRELQRLQAHTFRRAPDADEPEDTQKDFYEHREDVRARDQRLRQLHPNHFPGDAYINPLYLDEASLHRASLPRLSAVDFLGVDTSYVYYKRGFQFFNLHIEQMLFTFVHHQLQGESEWVVIPHSELPKLHAMAAEMYDTFYPGADPSLTQEDKLLLGRMLLYSKQIFPPLSLLHKYHIAYDTRHLHANEVLIADGGSAHFGFSTAPGLTLSVAANCATADWLTRGLPFLEDHYGYLDKLRQLQARKIPLGEAIQGRKSQLLPLQELVRKSHFLTPDNFTCSFLRGLFADLGVAFPEDGSEPRPLGALCDYPGVTAEQAAAYRNKCRELVRHIHQQRDWKVSTDGGRGCSDTCESYEQPQQIHTCMTCRCRWGRVRADEDLWEDQPAAAPSPAALSAPSPSNAKKRSRQAGCDEASKAAKMAADASAGAAARDRDAAAPDEQMPPSLEFNPSDEPSSGDSDVSLPATHSRFQSPLRLEQLQDADMTPTASDMHMPQAAQDWTPVREQQKHDSLACLRPRAPLDLPLVFDG